MNSLIAIHQNQGFGYPCRPYGSAESRMTWLGVPQTKLRFPGLMLNSMKIPQVGLPVIILPDYANLNNVSQKAWWAWVARQMKNADAALRAQLQEWRRQCRQARITAKFEAVGRHLTEAARAAAAWLAEQWAAYHRRQSTAYRAIRLGVW